MPIEPTEVQEANDGITEAPGLEAVQEEEAKEEENEEFPAFDEAQLPSMDELDQKMSMIG